MISYSGAFSHLAENIAFHIVLQTPGVPNATRKAKTLKKTAGKVSIAARHDAGRSDPADV